MKLAIFSTLVAGAAAFVPQKAPVVSIEFAYQPYGGKIHEGTYLILTLTSI